MRAIGKLHPTQDAYLPAGTGAIAALSTTPVAQDYPTGTRFLHIDTSVRCYVQLESTAAHLPAASIAATTSSTGRIEIIGPGHQHLFQIPGDSTGYSVIAGSTGEAAFHFYGVD